MSSIANYAFDSTDYNTSTINDQSGNGNNLSKIGSGGSWSTADPYSDSNIYSFRFNGSQHFERTITTYSGDFSFALDQKEVQC